jgi:hypothetical protein
MILQKLADAIRRQDWFVVLLEILVVVIGLFVGLQLDGWNEVRKDRLSEKNYLERLHRDVQRDSELLERSIEGAEWRARDAVYAMDALEEPAIIADDPCAFLASISGASANFYPVLYSHTFDEIVSSGDLKLMRNDQLKDELSQYYTAHESGGQWMDSMRQINLAYTAAFAGILSRKELEAISAFRAGGECLIEVDQAMAAMERILGRPGLADWLPRLEARQVGIAERLRRSRATNERLTALLSGELGRK